MRRSVRKTSAALLDLTDHYVTIARHSRERAERFLVASNETFRALLRMPHLGAALTDELSNMRQWRVRGFEKYLIFYRVHEDGIEIVRLLHGAQNWESILS